MILQDKQPHSIGQSDLFHLGQLDIVEFRIFEILIRGLGQD